MITITYNFQSLVKDIDETETSAEEETQEISGEIFFMNEDLVSKKIGRLLLVHLNLDEILKNDTDIFSILDTNGSLFHYYDTIIGDDSGFVELDSLVLDHYENNSEDFFLNSFNLLIIDKIEILPEFRGKDIVKKVIKNAGNLFLGTDLIVLNAYPLQFDYFEESYGMDEWEKSLKLEEFSQDGEVGTDKLIKAYEKSGFVSSKKPFIMFKLNN